jgi:hypothetical protein
MQEKYIIIGICLILGITALAIVVYNTNKLYKNCNNFYHKNHKK